MNKDDKIKLKGRKSESELKARIYLHHLAKNCKTKEDAHTIIAAISMALNKPISKELNISARNLLLLELAFPGKKLKIKRAEDE